MKFINKFIHNPYHIFIVFWTKGFLNFLPDKLFIKMVYRGLFGEKIDLKNPKNFSEKIQWLKLNDKKDIYTKMVDKYEVKDYVKNIIGDKYLIPTLGVYDTFDQIDFEKLPNQFVIKCTHDSGGICICKNKSDFNIIDAKKKINKCLNNNFYFYGREWPYKNVKPRIIIELFMQNGYDRDLTDYKFFCFNGVPKYCQVITDRSTNECIDFFDMEWIHQEFVGLIPKCPNSDNVTNSDNVINKPVNFEKMKNISFKLARNIRFVRIDFYEINGKLYFGEITFYPASGFGRFTPDEWNKRLGDMINL